jgi:Ni/Fe-hydrogenase 1 B-type cytochrome subunit
LTPRTAYPVWDRTTRVFHWVNVLCVLGLAALGIAILNEKSFGVTAEGKVLLKTLHSYVGYVFAVNLVWRLVWAFVGGYYARWKSVLPVGRGFGTALLAYVRGFIRGHPPTYVGHNPLARLMVTLLLLLLFIQAATGLVLAGTDLYQPPFGGAIAEWVTGGDSDKLSKLQPGSKDHVDLAAYDDMRAFRKPIVTTHLYVFYMLMASILIHIVSVVVTELREKNGLVSAMITGEKVLSDSPIDKE